MNCPVEGAGNTASRKFGDLPPRPATARESVDRQVNLIRTFPSGANRDTEDGKHDPEAFLSPLVINRYNEYMHHKRLLKDGTLRDGDNWQKGFPIDSFMKSGWRHFLDWWLFHRGQAHLAKEQSLEDALCALMFNVMGYLHESLKNKKYITVDQGALCGMSYGPFEFLSKK